METPHAFFTHKEKRAKQGKKRASEQGKQGMQAGKVASWSVGSRALVVSARGRNPEWGKGERGRRSGYHRKMEPRGREGKISGSLMN